MENMMESALRMIAAVTTCTYCDGTGIDPPTNAHPCPSCCGRKIMTVLNQWEAQQLAGVTLLVIQRHREATDAND